MPRYHKSTVSLLAHGLMVPIVGLAVSPAVAADESSPLNPNAKVLAMQYESPLADFRAFDPDQEMVPWKDANDRVGEIGGWRTYLRNATKKKGSSQSNSEMNTEMKHGNESKSGARK